MAWQSGALQDRSVGSSVQAFLRESGIVVLQGFVLSFLQVAVLGAVCVSLAAFLPPGSYTAIVGGKAGATGVALVEAYRVP